MSLRLVFGVLDLAYSDASGSGATTTGDVAEILEANYHIMATFYELRKEKIAGWLTDSMAESIELLIATGKRPRARKSGTLTFGADQKIKTEFRQFLDANEMARLHLALTGTDLSAAAAAGVNHRRKHPYAQKNKARPAFIDTGLYRSSFRVWTTKSAAIDLAVGRHG